MPLLSIELLGRPLDLHVRKELALLAYQAAEPAQRHRRDHLLWPSAPAQVARNRVRVVLATSPEHSVADSEVWGETHAAAVQLLEELPPNLLGQACVGDTIE